MTDSETTTMIYSALRKRYGDTQKYITACEVGNSTGAYQTNRLDFVAMELWPSLGFNVHAFEVKASKGDLKHELENPDKHNVFFEHIDTFSLIAPEGIIDISVLPKKWGIYAVKPDESIKCLRKPIPLHDEMGNDRRMRRGFVCSLLRCAISNSLDRRLFAKDNEEKMREAKEQLQAELTNGGRIISKEDYNDYLWMRPLCRRLGYYSRPDEEEIQKKLRVVDEAYWLRQYANRVISGIKEAERDLRLLRTRVEGTINEIKEKKQNGQPDDKQCGGVIPIYA